MPMACCCGERGFPSLPDGFGLAHGFLEGNLSYFHHTEGDLRPGDFVLLGVRSDAFEVLDGFSIFAFLHFLESRVIVDAGNAAELQVRPLLVLVEAVPVRC